MADLAAIFVKPCPELCNLSVIVFFKSQQGRKLCGTGAENMVISSKMYHLSVLSYFIHFQADLKIQRKKINKRVTYFFLGYNLNHTYSFILSKHGQHQKVDKSTVVPTKSDSDVIFCLLLFSKTLTCTLHLSLCESRAHLCINPIQQIGLIHK